MDAWQRLIVSSPDTLSGEVRIAGTRISVQTLMWCLADGWDESRIHGEYPHLPHGAVPAAAAYCAQLLDERATAAANPISSAPQAG